MQTISGRHSTTCPFQPIQRTDAHQKSGCTDLGRLSTTYPFLHRSVHYTHLSLQLCLMQSAQHCMGPRDLHNATLARTNPAFPCPVGAGQRPAHKTRTRSGERRRTCSTHTLPDPCAPAGGAALPVRVTRKLCLPNPSWATQRESGEGASMSLIHSNMTLPFRREQPGLIGAPHQSHSEATAARQTE